MEKKKAELTDKELDELLSEIPEGATVDEDNIVDDDVIVDDAAAEELTVFEEVLEEKYEAEEAEDELADADLELTEEEAASLNAEENYGEEVVKEESEEDAVEELPEEEVEAESEEENDKHDDTENKKKGHPVLKFLGGLTAFAAVAGVSGVGGYHLHKHVFDKPHQEQIDKDEQTFDVVISYLGATGVTIKDITGNGFIYSMNIDNKNEIVYYSYSAEKSYNVVLTDVGFEQFKNNQDGNIVLKSEYFGDVESKRIIVELYLGTAKNNIAALENQVTALNLRLTAERKKVNELKNGIAEINKLFANPEDETVNDSIETLKANVQTLIETYSATQDKIKELNNKYGVEGSDSLDDIENALQDAEAVKNKIKELNDEYGEEGSDSLENIEDALQDAKAVNQAVAQTIAGLEELLGKEPSGSDKVEDLDELIAEIGNKYADATATADSLQAENERLAALLSQYLNTVENVTQTQSGSQTIVANGGGTDSQNTRDHRGDDVEVQEDDLQRS